MKLANFRIEELVCPEIFAARGERAWELLRPEALMALQALRNKFGTLIVNNYHAGGPYSESGMRRLDTKTGALYSMHKFGSAFDCKFKSVTPQEVYDYVLLHRAEFPTVTTMEDIRKTPGWNHIDTRNTDVSGIMIVEP